MIKRIISRSSVSALNRRWVALTNKPQAPKCRAAREELQAQVRSSTLAMP
jgi:hypothetical protein